MAIYWKDTDSSVHHGDALEILPDLGVEPDLIITSPPYGALRKYGGHGFDFYKMADAIFNVMPEGGVLVWVVGDTVINGSESGASFEQALHFKNKLGLRLHDTMIYHKNVLGNPTPVRYHQQFEYMFVFSLGAPKTVSLIEDVKNKSGGQKIKHNYPSGRSPDGKRPRRTHDRVIREMGRRSNVWKYNAGYNHSAPDFLDAHNHPAIMPLLLAKDHIRTWTNPGDLVLDPMAGSGTTLKAAKDMNRQGVGVEINAEYCELIARRLSQQALPLE